jgi:hypothetical protein
MNAGRHRQSLGTPAYSPDSNRPGGGLVHTFKRDYVNVHNPHDAGSVLAQLGGWIDDCNRRAPHSALGMRPPAEHRATLNLSKRLGSRSL